MARDEQSRRAIGSKTDRRHAEKLARYHRSGDLTAIWVPDAQHEALRDPVRAREAARKDQLRAPHNVFEFEKYRTPHSLRQLRAAIICAREI